MTTQRIAAVAGPGGLERVADPIDAEPPPGQDSPRGSGVVDDLDYRWARQKPSQGTEVGQRERVEQPGLILPGQLDQAARAEVKRRLHVQTEYWLDHHGCAGSAQSRGVLDPGHRV